MEQALLATLGILAALVAGLLKSLHTSQKTFSTTIGGLVDELRQNTESIRELRDYQKEHARAQRETNQTLQELLQLQRKEATNG